MIRNARIAIIVQGRFHAFGLARALIDLGAKVDVITNYPKFIAKRFGLPGECITSFPLHGILHRYAYRWDLVRRIPFLEVFLHRSFSIWSARRISLTEPTIVHAFSGMALDVFAKISSAGYNGVKTLVRGSCHIRDQYHLLEQESRRADAYIEKPSMWMIKREMAEYKQADAILVLSSFAKRTFIKRGYEENKIQLQMLGTNVGQFRPSRAIIEDRLRRIKSGHPLEFICTGTVCLRKGILDFIEIAKVLRGRIRFRWVGNIAADARGLVEKSSDLIEFVPRQNEENLPEFYNRADGYLFPTIEDGFAVVLAQARAACLPILASENCAAPDLVQDGNNGWSLPIRQPERFIEKLLLLDGERETMARMVENLWQQHDTRDWPDVAKDFIDIIGKVSNEKYKLL